ncbi:MAG: ankyrin repeat domain-containing protein, partial [Anaerolineae bacterium]|nr:ankyrin repeat domain-containing protein [Anaerolineae bacterium]
HWVYAGTIAFNIGTGKRRLPDPETEDFIIVIREELKETATVPLKANLERGFAYQWLGKNKFHKIRQVDLSLSDEEISKLFGVGKPSNEQLLTEMLKGREIDLEEATRLLKAVRNVNYRGPSGRGIIHQGSYSGHLEILKVLIDRGANPNLRGMGEGTPLISAAAGGSPEIVEYLISLGADIQLIDSYGEGALHYAMYNDGCLECAKILIAHGADPTLKSKDGKTPLELAKSNKGTLKNYDEMITYLSSL